MNSMSYAKCKKPYKHNNPEYHILKSLAYFGNFAFLFLKFYTLAALDCFPCSETYT